MENQDTAEPGTGGTLEISAPVASLALLDARHDRIGADLASRAIDALRGPWKLQDYQVTEGQGAWNPSSESATFVISDEVRVRVQFSVTR